MRLLAYYFYLFVNAPAAVCAVGSRSRALTRIPWPHRQRGGGPQPTQNWPRPGHTAIAEEGLSPCIPPQPLIPLPRILVPLAAAPGGLPSPRRLPPALPGPPVPPVLPVPPILPSFPALRGSDALREPQAPFAHRCLAITVRLLQAEMPSGRPGVRRALLRPLLPPLDGLRASARLLTQENQQGPVRASPEQQR